MRHLTKEFLVGLMVVLVIALMLVFGWLMGVVGPFRKEMKFHLLYAFAGGVEAGSPVRVSGVKVGKVDRIEFVQGDQNWPEDNVTLKVTISVSPRAAATIRQDSQFFINIAGLIGERYVEISPGSASSALLEPGASVRGVDPPRVDQLLSQGYGVFGRVQELISQNEKSITEFLKQLNEILTDTNKILKGKDKKRIFDLVDNMNVVTGDLREITKALRDPETREIYRLMFDIVRRAHDVDKPALKKFLQEEGVRARIF